MTKQAGFWRAMEAVLGLRAVPAEWRLALGEDWRSARSLLRPTGELAFCHPKPPSDLERPSPYEVVCHDAATNDYVGVCPDGGESIRLTRVDLAILELDMSTVATRLCGALGFMPACDRLSEPRHAFRVGVRHAKESDDETWAYFASPPEAEDLSAVVAGLAVRHAGPFLLLTPTRSLWRAWHETLRREGEVAALEEWIAIDAAGGFSATAAARAGMVRLGRLAEFDPVEGVFRREGVLRRIEWQGQSAVVRDSQGCRHIAHLLANPRKHFHAAELRALVAGRSELTAAAKSGGQAAMSAQAWADLRIRFEELTMEREEAEGHHDAAAVARCEAELAELTSMAEAAQGKGGRDRRIGDPAEQARKAVCLAVERALTAIGRVHEPLARHLDACIRRGAVLHYDPDAEAAWRL